MASPEEIPNIEPFPLSPRLSRRESESDVPVPSMPGPARSFTPLYRTKVEFWHHGEQPSRAEKPPRKRRYDHARRADQMGLLMGILAVVVIVLVFTALSLNKKKYAIKPGSEKKSTAPEVDFYQGNQTFDRKVKEEKAGMMATDLPVQGATEDFEISLQAQMASMNEKLEKIRSQKLIEEPPVPLQDKGAHPAPVIGVSPTQIQNFSSPLEFNSMLPKPLQNGH